MLGGGVVVSIAVTVGTTGLSTIRQLSCNAGATKLYCTDVTSTHVIVVVGLQNCFLNVRDCALRVMAQRATPVAISPLMKLGCMAYPLEHRPSQLTSRHTDKNMRNIEYRVTDVSPPRFDPGALPARDTGHRSVRLWPWQLSH